MKERFVKIQNRKKILELYTKFLTLNDGFVNTKKTSDIKLPEEFEKLKIEDDIFSLINNAINDKSLETLLTRCILP